MTDVKPCPFCGGTTIRTHEGSTFRWLYAACYECGARAGEVRKQTIGTPGEIGPDIVGRWRREGDRRAIEEWNRRAPQQDEQTPEPGPNND